MIRTLFLSGWLSCVFAGAAMTLSPAIAQDLGQQREDREHELEQVRESLNRLSERREALRAEIKALDQDVAAINRALIEAAKRTQDLEAAVDLSESRLSELNGTRDEILKSLSSKRALLAEVIGALQRMGRKPPPAILITPADALASVRSAIMLGAVVPQIHSETQTLAVELQALADTTKHIEAERKALGERLNALAEDETRLTLLVEEKTQLVQRSRQSLDEDRRKAQELARSATSLKQLIADLESQIESAAEAAKAAQQADAKRRADAEQRLADAREQLTALREKSGSAGDVSLDGLTGDTARITPAIAFSDAKGLLPLPVQGVELHGFGARSVTGDRTRNVAFATRANARVRSPADGWVVYAGPFRSYGQLLILNAGQGYHVVLSGLSQVNVTAGRFVLAGEPIGRMGVTRVAAAAPLALGSTRPVLYVEFRKDGKTIDPAPWWAARHKGPDNDS